LTSTANLITRDILRLPHPSILDRYTNIFLVFSLSGLIHYVNDGASGRELWLPTLVFFQSFALGIMVEDGVQEIWRRTSGFKGKKDGNDDDSVPLWQILVGFVWVAAFFCVVSPWFVYQTARVPSGSNWMFPFSIADFIGIQNSAILAAIGGVLLKILYGGEI
jgi:Membrane bound O-acyl transferase family